MLRPALAIAIGLTVTCLAFVGTVHLVPDQPEIPVRRVDLASQASLDIRDEGPTLCGRACKEAKPESLEPDAPPGEPLEIRVLGVGDQPLRGARVGFFSQDDQRRTREPVLFETTSVDGVVRVPEKADLDYYVRFSCPHYFSTGERIWKPKHGRQIDIRLLPHIHITGTVLDDEGTPVAGATVSIDQRYAVRYRLRGLKMETETDNHGRWRAIAEPWKVTVRVSAEGQPSATLLAELVPDDPLDWTVRLRNDRRVRGWIHAPDLRRDVSCEVKQWARKPGRDGRGPDIRRVLAQSGGLRYGDTFAFPAPVLESGERSIATLHVNGWPLPSKTLSEIPEDLTHVRISVDTRRTFAKRIEASVPEHLRERTSVVTLIERAGASLTAHPDTTTGHFAFEDLPDWKYRVELRDANDHVLGSAQVETDISGRTPIEKWSERRRGKRRARSR